MILFAAPIFWKASLIRLLSGLLGKKEDISSTNEMREAEKNKHPINVYKSSRNSIWRFSKKW